MRIVIAGAGEVGYKLAETLAAKHEVYVIESNEERFQQVSLLDVVAIKGNAANIRNLRSAEVQRADVFLAVTGDDEVNLLSALAAKRLGAKTVIARVENPEYVDRPIVRDHPLGYDILICPQLALAHEAARIVGIPGAVDIVTFSNGKVEMLELIVMEGSKADGRTVRELELPKNVVITTVYRNGEVLIPRGDTVLKAGDRVAIVGRSSEIEGLAPLFGTAVVKKVSIFGAGTIGSYVAKILSRGAMRVKVIDSSLERCQALSEELSGVKIVRGDGTDIELLREENVGDSDAVVATTESDEKNLLICLLAKNLGAKKTIAKVERGDYVRIFEAVGVDVALNPRAVTYNEVMRFLRRMRVETVADIEGAAALEIVVRNREVAGKKLRELPLPDRAIVGAIIRGEDCLIPRGDTEVELGDSLLVFVDWKDIEKVEKVFA
ncbi:MAG: Trk system potassium transporter TrkA [Archaeoglobaceae archaeon]